MIGARLVIALATAAFLVGCTGASITPADKAPFVQSQKEQARKLQQQGRLAEALAFWRSTLPAGKPDTETRQAIAQLEKQISASVRDLGAQAKAAYASGNRSRGDYLALKMLALQPGEPRAREWLVASTRIKAQQQASEKASDAYEAAPVSPGSEGPAQTASTAPVSTSGELRKLHTAKDYNGVIALADTLKPAPDSGDALLVRSAHVALGEQTLSRGDSEAAIGHFRGAMKAHPQANDPLRQRIAEVAQSASDEWYRKGRKALNTDIDAAIAAFESALALKPDHAAAKSALKRAQTLKRNLERIEQR